MTVRRIGAEDAGQRLDRWLRRAFPGLTQGRIQQLLRKGHVRVDGARAKADRRLAAGEEVRAPEGLGADAGSAPRPEPANLSEEDRAFVRGLVIARADGLLALDKPAGLAVQGGAKVRRSLDALLPGLVKEGASRPRLVHRLDRDTSGVLAVALDRRAAADAAAAFAGREARKLYLAVVAPAPMEEEGRIDAALAKRAGADGRERARTGGGDAKDAVTDFVVLARAARKAALLALMPRTGRTHQLRAHCALIGAPILGDKKYGAAAIAAEGVAARLHLHAHRLRLPYRGGVFDVTAAAPAHMEGALAAYGLEVEARLLRETFER